MSASPRAMPNPDYRHHRVTTDDGVELAVQTIGEGPAVLLANGIGVTTPGMDLITAHLCDRSRVVCWDYRGAGDSRVDGLDVEFTIARHAKDALEVLDAVGEDRAAVLGWSLGVPLGLEMIRQSPDRITAYGALFGSARPAFERSAFNPKAFAVELALKLLGRFPHAAQALLDLSVRVPDLAWLTLTTIQFMGRHAHREIFHENVRCVARADKRAYFGTMAELLPYDARDVLPTVRCPVLAVAGTNDWLTPPSAAQEIATLAPDAELVILEGATHFGVIEYGHELWDPIDRLLERGS